MEILDEIPVQLAANQVIKRMRLGEDLADSARELVALAQRVARPRALYKVCYVDNRQAESVELEGITFTSRVLRRNLDQVERVFAYVATCGRELEEVSLPTDDFMAPYIMDTIKESVLGSAVGYLFSYLQDKYALGQTSHMSPGSLEDWPITQQKELFSLFGDVKQLIGVQLTDTFLMYPVKSVSGVLFPTEIRFKSCQLCPRPGCRNRSAPYDPALAAEYEVGDGASQGSAPT